MDPIAPSDIPLVGRKKELDELEGYFEDVEENEGSSVLITGEAGIGKTKLIEEFMDHADERGFHTLKGEGDSDSMKPFLLFSSALEKRISEPLFKEKESTTFKEIFAVNDAGILLAKSSSGEEELDADIFAGMLSAVQNFVKDSFDQAGSKKGGLGRLEYGDMKILIEHGEHIYIAGVIKGSEHPDMKHLLTRTVRMIEDENADILQDWGGDMEEMDGVQNEIDTLSETKFTVRKELEGVKLKNERIRIADKVLDRLTKMGDRGPLLLVLENLQWADESSLFVFNYVARNISNEKIMILGAARHGESEPLEKTLENMRDEGTLNEIEIDELTDDDIRSLVNEIYESNDFPDGFCRTLSQECVGNPYFVIELLRQMEQERNIVFDEEQYTLVDEEYSIPSSVEEVVQRRINTLDPVGLAMVEYAACEGKEMDRTVLDSFPLTEDINSTLNSLEEVGILDRKDGRCDFSHAIFRDVVYNNVSNQWKSTHHRSIGEYYEVNYRDRIDEVLYDLARHFSNTIEYEKAHDYSFGAGEKAENALAPEQAVEFYNDSLKALSQMTSVEDRVEREIDILDRLGDMRVLLGDFDEAIDHFRNALESEYEDEELASFHRKIANVLMNTGEYDESLDECDTGLDLLGDEDHIERARILRVRGRTYMRKGDYDRAGSDLQEGVKIAEQFEDRGEIAEIEHNYGTVQWYLGDYEEALDHLNKALDIRKERGEERGVARAYTNMGIVYGEKGELDKAIDNFENGLESFEKIGDKLNMASTMINLGMAYYKRGYLDNAEDYFKKSLSLFKKVGDRSSVATALNNLGLIFEDKGEMDESLKYHKDSLKIRKEIGDKQGMAMSYNNLGVIEREIGKIGRANDYHDKALKISSEIGNRNLTVEILCENVRCNILQKNVEKAMKHAEKALEMSQDMDSDLLEGRCREVLGIVHKEKKNYDNAAEEFEKAIKIYEDIDERSGLSSVLYEYSNLLIAIGEKEKATENLKRTLDLQNRLGMSLKKEKTERLLNRLLNKK